MTHVHLHSLLQPRRRSTRTGVSSLHKSRASKYFIKFDRRIHEQTGCMRATLIASALEYWFSKKPGGFYKFVEPCCHRLYKPGDSWTEEMGCDRKSFSKSFDRIGVRYVSRTAYERAPDKFQGKRYASFYDRHVNQMFFMRNPDGRESEAESRDPDQDPSLSCPDHPDGFKNHPAPQEGSVARSSTRATPVNSDSCAHPDSASGNGKEASLKPLRNGKECRSSKEAKNTPKDLSDDKSHAGNEIVQKMIELWTAVVEGGKAQIELTGKLTGFLKQAFKDKFDQRLDKWKDFCQKVASSKFLMGENKSSFKATLEWALKFESIRKILEGQYGIGDRNPERAPSRLMQELIRDQEETKNLEARIRTSGEPVALQDFRLRCLKTWGSEAYQDLLNGCEAFLEELNALFLRPASRYQAKWLAGRLTPAFLSAAGISCIHIVQEEGDLRFERWIRDDAATTEPTGQPGLESLRRGHFVESPKPYGSPFFGMNLDRIAGRPALAGGGGQ